MRSSIMCYADLTPHPLIWSGRRTHPLVAGPNVARQCLDWERLQEFVKPRHYNFTDVEKGMKEAGLEIPYTE